MTYGAAEAEAYALFVMSSKGSSMLGEKSSLGNSSSIVATIYEQGSSNRAEALPKNLIAHLSYRITRGGVRRPDVSRPGARGEARWEKDKRCAICELRWDFLEEGRMKEYSRYKYFP